MILSHDQSQVEYGFSFNSKILVQNLQKENLVAQRHVIDHMHYNSIQAHKLTMTKKLIDNVKKAYSRCYATMNEKSQSKLQSNKQKLKALNDDIDEINQQNFCAEKDHY